MRRIRTACFCLTFATALISALPAAGQSAGAPWQLTASIAPLAVWDDQLNDSNYGLEIGARAQWNEGLAVPLGVGVRAVTRNTPHGWVQERGAFVGAEFRPFGFPYTIDVGYFAVERGNRCDGCRTDDDSGLDLTFGVPSVVQYSVGRLEGTVSVLTRTTFGDGFGYYTSVGFGLSLPGANPTR